MKKLLLFIFISIISFSCREDEILNPELSYRISDIDIKGESYKKIEGVISEDMVLDPSTKWILSGGVFVDEGVTLTIPTGQVIYADTEVTTFLSVKQGGKILATGTKTNPIVFTPLTDEPTYGDWGGIIINGYGILNTGLTAEGEGGTGTYGGTDNADNSGIIRYVRVEYAGKILGTDNELNGFSFNGVGNGTTVEYIQAYKGADDGIEFFGGGVNVRYAVSTCNQDDSFDWTHGWVGNGQYWYVNQGEDGGDRGIEADNNGDDNTLEPYSNPTLSNITLIGVDDGDQSNTGIRLREGTKGKIYNAIITGFPNNGVRVSDDVSLTHMNNGELVVSNSNVYDNGTDYKDCEIFETLTETVEHSWFVNDTTIGAGIENGWLNGWTRE